MDAVPRWNVYDGVSIHRVNAWCLHRTGQPADKDGSTLLRQESLPGENRLIEPDLTLLGPQPAHPLGTLLHPGTISATSATTCATVSDAEGRVGYEAHTMG